MHLERQVAFHAPYFFRPLAVIQCLRKTFRGSDAAKLQILTRSSNGREEKSVNDGDIGCLDTCCFEMRQPMGGT